MATILKSWLVALTAGVLKPRKLTWKGKIRKAPDTPPIEVKKEITKATRGGIQGLTSISAIGKYILKSSMLPLGNFSISQMACCPQRSCQSICLMLSITCFKGGVAKWLRRRSAKPLFPGSSPGAASNTIYSPTIHTPCQSGNEQLPLVYTLIHWNPKELEGITCV